MGWTLFWQIVILVILVWMLVLMAIESVKKK